MSEDKNSDLNLSRAAIASGASLLVMTVLSFAIFPTLKSDLVHAAGILIIIILDIVIAWYLYVFFKPANKNLSAISALLRTIYAIFFAIALSQISNLDAFNAIWEKSLLIFGFHLLFLGILSIKATYTPKLLGYLVIITSLGYIIDATGKFLGYSSQLGLFVFWGEILLGLWLVIAGRKITNTSF